MAQLGARLHGMQKVASSSLAGSSCNLFQDKHLQSRTAKQQVIGASPWTLASPLEFASCRPGLQESAQDPLLANPTSRQKKRKRARPAH